jgi:hypothetical protein
MCASIVKIKTVFTKNLNVIRSLSLTLCVIMIGCSSGPKIGTTSITGVDPSKVCKGDRMVNWIDCIGSVTFPDGRNYVGDFKNGWMDGQGRMIWTNGNRYVGQFTRDNVHGFGTITYPNGSKYVGQFARGMYSGQGTLTFPNRDTFVGEFKNHATFRGKMTYADGRPARSGLWDRGNLVQEDLPTAQQLFMPSVSPMNYDDAKQKCSDLGFKSGTEGFGKCVLQLSK